MLKKSVKLGEQPLAITSQEQAINCRLIRIQKNHVNATAMPGLTLQVDPGT